MTTSRIGLARQAELTKLSRALHTPIDQLGALGELPRDVLVTLRELLSDAVAEDAAEQIDRIVAASKLVPIPVAASLAQKMGVPPALGAAVAGSVPAERGVKYAKHFKPEFMADVAPYMDPKRAAPLLAAAPIAQGIAVMKVLIERGDFITMGRMVGAVSDETLTAGMEIADDNTMLQVASVVEDRTAVDRIFRVVPERRIVGLLHEAAQQDQWADVLDLLTDVGAQTAATVGELLTRQPDALISSLVGSAQREGLWDQLLQLLALVEPAGVARMARVKAVQSADVLAALVDSAGRRGTWPTVLPLLAELPDHVIGLVEALPSLTDPLIVGQIIDAAQRTNGLRYVLPLIASASDVVAADLARRDESAIDGLVAAAVATDQWDKLLPLIPHLPPRLRERVTTQAATLDKDALGKAFAAASGSGQLNTLLDVAAELPPQQRATVVDVVVENAEDDDLLGSALADEDRRQLWTKLLAVADGVSEPLLGRLGARAAELDLDSVVPTILAAADTTGMWKTGMDLLSGAGEHTDVVASAVQVPSDLLQRAAEQADTLGIGDRLGPLGAMLDAQRTGQITNEFRQRTMSLVHDPAATADQLVALVNGVTGGVLAAPLHAAQDLAAKLPGIGGLFGGREKEHK